MGMTVIDLITLSNRLAELIAASPTDWAEVQRQADLIRKLAGAISRRAGEHIEETLPVIEDTRWIRDHDDDYLLAT